MRVMMCSHVSPWDSAPMLCTSSKITYLVMMMIMALMREVLIGIPQTLGPRIAVWAEQEDL